MIPHYAKPFAYQVPWKSNSSHYGEHRGTQRGLGFEYKGNVSLVDYPDARRMDLRQTLRDPFEQVQVKIFNQDNTTPIYAVCDLSSSMQFQGDQRKLNRAMEISASIAYSSYEAGDVFSFIGYHQHVVEELTLPLSHYVHQSFSTIEQLSDFREMRVGSEGIFEVPLYLSQNKGLVFWVSDFHMPITQIEQALNMMSQHQVVPIVLWDDREYKRLPKFGFGTMVDPESGLNRTYFFRESLRLKFIEAFAQRRQLLEDLFFKFDYPPLFIQDAFKPETMTHYFEQYMNL